jgi:hypothetical protein
VICLGIVDAQTWAICAAGAAILSALISLLAFLRTSSHQNIENRIEAALDKFSIVLSQRLETVFLRKDLAAARFENLELMIKHNAHRTTRIADIQETLINSEMERRHKERPTGDGPDAGNHSPAD